LKIFSISLFLIKDGHAGVKIVNGNPIAYAAKPPLAEDYSSGKAERKQCVVGLDYAGWEKIKAKYNISKSYLPSRKPGQYFYSEPQQSQQQESEPPESPPKKRRVVKKKVEKEDVADDDSSELPESPPVSKRKRDVKKKAVDKGDEIDSDSSELPESPPPKKKRIVKKKVVEQVEESHGDGNSASNQKEVPDSQTSNSPAPNKKRVSKKGEDEENHDDSSEHEILPRKRLRKLNEQVSESQN